MRVPVVHLNLAASKTADREGRLLVRISCLPGLSPHPLVSAQFGSDCAFPAQSDILRKCAGGDVFGGGWLFFVPLLSCQRPGYRLNPGNLPSFLRPILPYRACGGGGRWLHPNRDRIRPGDISFSWNSFPVLSPAGPVHHHLLLPQ